MPDGRRTLVLDFDGVIHSYVSGWIQHNIIPDPPVAGAFEFITEAQKHFRVAVFSSRSSKTMGIEAMREWFLNNGMSQDVLDELDFPTAKPAAFVTIDDRAITFRGAWPTIVDLLNFRTWQQRDS